MHGKIKYNPDCCVIKVMRILLSIITLLVLAADASAQGKAVQNRPYTDLRPFHFGVVVGMHFQDIEFNNIGPQLITSADGTQAEKIITCDQDRWDMGFNVGVLGELRLSNHFAFRVAPTMYFGNRHLTLYNLTDKLEDGSPIIQHQDMKSVYIAAPLNLLFSAPRMDNVRPYMMAGVDPMINLTGGENDYVRLKRYDFFVELGLGCDIYLPFFKLRPELKFCYSLINSLDKNHADRLRDENMIMYARSVDKAHSKMIVLSFYFE